MDETSESGRPTRLRAVLWDLDGTLLDSEGAWDVGLSELANRLGGELTPRIRQALLGASNTDSVEILFAETGHAPDKRMMGEAHHWLLARVAELFTEGVPACPGAADALRLVRDAGLGSALITNTERSLAEYGLNTLGRQHFDVSVCGDEVETGKPAPDVYVRGMELLGVTPAECVAVEDSATGAAAAHAAGCGLVIVPSDPSLEALPGWVRRDSLVGLTIDDLLLATL